MLFAEVLLVKYSARVSSKPSKKRKAFFNAPLHERQKLVSVHLSRELRKKLKKRSIPIRKGDKVLVLKGRFKKKEGTVSRVSLNGLKVFIEGVLIKKQRGGEKLAPLVPSQLVALQLAERRQQPAPGSAAKKQEKIV